MVTDRDIVCRGCADGRDPTSMTARDVMTSGIVYCTENQSIEDAIHMMEEKQIRRMPVINGKKRMTGMLSLGDLAHSTKPELTGELAQSVSAHPVSACGHRRWRPRSEERRVGKKRV